MTASRSERGRARDGAARGETDREAGEALDQPRRRSGRGTPFEIGGRLVQPGESARIDLPAALLPTHTQLDIPLTVINAPAPGPRVWISAAVHGDEVNGVEIICRVLDRVETRLRRGVLVATPIVNVFGFIGQSRYLPDRRDLNRSFPGSRGGSLASRIAHRFLNDVVARCTHGLDLHTAAKDRSNLPQTRGNMADPEIRRLAEAFGAPVMLQSGTVNGSLRAAATKLGIPVLVFEGGEAQRFNEDVIEVGVRGVLGVLQELGMLPRRKRRRQGPSILVTDSTWIRARRGGLLRLSVPQGKQVIEEDQEIGTVSDPFGDDRISLRAPFRGLVIGHTKNPVVHGGDAVVHLGRLGGPDPLVRPEA